MLVDLTTLPDFVESECKKCLDNLQERDIIFNYDRLKFPSLHKRFVEIFQKPVKEKKIKSDKQQMELV